MKETITKDQLLSADFIADLFLEEDPVLLQETLTKYEDIAKDYSCKTQFKDLVKAHKKMIERERKKIKDSAAENALQVVSNTYTVVSGDDVYKYNTGSWLVTENGIKKMNDKRYVIASYYPVTISQILTDRNTGDEKLTLVWKKKHVTKSITTLRSVISSANQIVSLSKTGFPVTTETAKNLIRYLTDFEALNDIETIVSSSKYGWADGEFIPYTDKIFFDGSVQFKPLVESVHEEGSYGAWLDEVRKIRANGRKEPMVYLASSFGSIILHLLKIQPFVVNIYGKTGSGKTVSLMLATSVWANPAQRGYISESNSTLNALEQKLDVLNNLPLMIDDMSKLRGNDRLTLAKIIYHLCAGGGKNRLDRNVAMRETSTWSNAILTNMERPLADETMQAGAINRVLDFEVESGDIYNHANDVVTVLSENYGHAGRRFVEAVQEIGSEKVRDMVRKYCERIKEEGILLGDEKEEKQTIPLAILMTADEISEKYLFQDGKRLDFDYCMAAIKGKRQVSEMDRAYKHFIDAYNINKARFNTIDNYGELWGMKMTGNYVAVIPSALEKIANQYNFSAPQFVKWCKENELLSCDAGRNQKYVSFGDVKERTRCYVIKIDDTERRQETVINGDKDYQDEPLPFDMPK